ncbi:hypothetical protein PQR53_38005 [Paraburkholderia fungorum]|uniref:hypothetical protein n=1 Tax=Paraburkholderia fungorum TaxID=134537 RepID=UPI0038B6BE52
MIGFTPLLRAQVARRMPTPVNFRERAALELDGFAEYSEDVTSEQFFAIDNLAAQIVKSNDTADPIYEFRVEGFADVARRYADPQERKAREQKVSEDRAKNGFDLLVEALERKGGEAFAQKIKKGSTWFGLGTKSLKVPNASTEAQFRRNRRVVFIVRQVTFIPPPPEPPEPPRSVVEDRFSVQLLRTGSGTLTVSPGIESHTLAATVQIVDGLEKKAALFNVYATGVGVGGGPWPVGGSLTTGPGPVVNFKTFRLLGRGAPTISLKSFEGMVTVFVDIGGGLGPLTKGGTLSFSFDGLQSNGANTMPQVIRVPAGGNSTVMAPGLSAGDVALGRISMVGAPFDI